MSNVNFSSVASSLGKLSPDQQKMVDAAPADQKAMMQMQAEQQNQQELVTFITNMMQMKHEEAMAIANNLKA